MSGGGGGGGGNCNSYPEARWIETEVRHGRPANAGGNDEDGEDDDDDEHLDDLFADPDPYETFDYQWQVVAVGNQNLNGHAADGGDRVADETIRLSVTGQKAENGQTLRSTGLTVWRAAGLLADWLVAQRNAGACCLLQPPRQPQAQPQRCGTVVLELGAGLGVPGLLCYRLGAAVTLLTDGDTDALTNLRANVARNCPATATSRDGGGGGGSEEHDATTTATIAPIIACQQLVWGDAAQIQAVHATLQRMADAAGCSRGGGGGSSGAPALALPPRRQCDVILGADLIYVADAIGPLFKTVRQLLQPGTGVFLLAYARRNVPIDAVLAAAAHLGFTYTAPSTPEGVYTFNLTRAVAANDE